MPADIASIMAMLQGGPKNLDEQGYTTFDGWLKSALGMNPQQVPFALRSQLYGMYQQGNSSVPQRVRDNALSQARTSATQNEDWARWAQGQQQNQMTDMNNQQKLAQGWYWSSGKLVPPYKKQGGY